MRSSKSRSRSKGNRNRSVGNIVNRVFESSGPEGKVRGTPQQIIDKYNQLARDAQLSNDRVATESFLQHAEHYTRLLAEGMREQQERQQQNQQNQPNNQNAPGNQHTQGGQRNDGGGSNDSDQRSDDGQQPEPKQTRSAPSRSAHAKSKDKAPGDGPQPSVDVIDTSEQSDSGLVETPENKPQRPRRTRKKPEPVAEAEAPEATTAPPDAAE